MKDKKRRKLNDNSYIINYLENEKEYYLEFNDKKNKFKMEISKELYDLFDKFELEDKSYMNKYDRHIEHFCIDDINLNKRVFCKEITLENEVIENVENDNLYQAIHQLPEFQRKRIYSYYFLEKTQKEIAKEENCSIRAVQYSLESALKNLKNLLN